MPLALPRDPFTGSVLLCRHATFACAAPGGCCLGWGTVAWFPVALLVLHLLLLQARGGAAWL